MLNVKTPDEALNIIKSQFSSLGNFEYLPLSETLGRTLAEDIKAEEYVPDFDRSTVDGFAFKAADSFGCSEAIPAIFTLAGEVIMGEKPEFTVNSGNCAKIPTGGAVPKGADCVQMLEYSENYGDGSIGIMKAPAPGQNIISRGDDVYPGKTVLQKGSVLRPQDIGALAALGIVSVPVAKKIKIGIISTGDELVRPEEKPKFGEIRDVNGPAVSALLKEYGAEVKYYGIVRDDERLLYSWCEKALRECDGLIISGGSSVGQKDAAEKVISSLGEVIFHGIAIKPGKPTILGKAGGKPVIGLPGHPAAAFLITKLFVLPLLNVLTGRIDKAYSVNAVLSENLSANHGRAEIVSVKLKKEGDRLIAEPVRGKSGLISVLSSSDGYFIIERDREGLPQGAEVQVYIN